MKRYSYNITSGFVKRRFLTFGLHQKSVVDVILHEIPIDPKTGEDMGPGTEEKLNNTTHISSDKLGIKSFMKAKYGEDVI